VSAEQAAEGGKQTNSDGTVSEQWCSWHDGIAPSRPVEVIERGPGAGGILYACRPCRVEHKLETLPTVVAWAALFDHLGGTADTKPCEPCNRHEPCPEGVALWAEYRRQLKADE
jgi:hypothetical protein